MPKKDENANPNRPGVQIHAKRYSSSGGLADWGPLMTWFKGLWRKVWHRH